MSQPAPNLGLETESKGRPGPHVHSGIHCIAAGRESCRAPKTGSPGCAHRAQRDLRIPFSLSLTGCLCFDLLLQTVPVKIIGHLHIKGRISNQSPLWNQGRALGGNRKETLRLDPQAICAEELGQQTPRRTRCWPAGTPPDCDF